MTRSINYGILFFSNYCFNLHEGGYFLKILYIVLGFLFFGLGAIGALVPVLPTTPFLLLASFFFAKGSDRFNRWFMNTSLYKNHLESFYESRSMTRKTKVSLLTFATSMMLLSLYFMPSIYGKIFMICMILFLHYYFHFRIRTIRETSSEPSGRL